MGCFDLFCTDLAKIFIYCFFSFFWVCSFGPSLLLQLSVYRRPVLNTAKVTYPARTIFLRCNRRLFRASRIHINQSSAPTRQDSSVLMAGFQVCRATSTMFEVVLVSHRVQSNQNYKAPAVCWFGFHLLSLSWRYIHHQSNCGKSALAWQYGHFLKWGYP